MFVKSFDTLKDTKALESLGISFAEAAIYLSALDLGSASISELASNAKIERTRAYYHIEQMLDTGLLKTTTKGKRTYYIPADPALLKELQDKNTKKLEALYPKLEDQFDKESGLLSSEHFRGTEENDAFYDRMYELMSKIKAPNNVLYVIGTRYKTIDIRYKHKDVSEFVPPKDQLNVITKCILPKSSKSKEPGGNKGDPYIVTRYNLPEAELRFISDKFAYPGAVVIMNDIIAFYDSMNFSYSIITSKNVARTWEMFFKYMWGTLKS